MLLFKICDVQTKFQGCILESTQRLVSVKFIYTNNLYLIAYLIGYNNFVIYKTWYWLIVGKALISFCFSCFLFILFCGIEIMYVTNLFIIYYFVCIHTNSCINRDEINVILSFFITG